jgi:hypothetical protein
MVEQDSTSRLHDRCRYNPAVTVHQLLLSHSEHHDLVFRSAIYRRIRFTAV